MTATFRLRLVAGCLLLVGLAFVQDPGFLVSDTKFDLAVAPTDFLSRALHLWDAEGALGQLQNQAYGYLWPMGPFFAVGALIDLPGWVIQRLWQGLVLAVAFSGSARVARALGVRSDLACLVAGFAFALSPRMLSTLGPISIEAWPSAVAPWVLLPLVRGSSVGSPRRAAALSALAVAMVGGVNAAATFAVLPLGVVWLLTRTPGPRRRALMLWWPTFTLLGTLWWLMPLFVMGAYSPPFLDYIETTAVTTFPTTLFDALRGTSNWVPYIDSGSRAGNDLLRVPYLVLNSGVLLLLGFAGLIDRRTPHRAFLVLSLLLGLLMVTAGHDGSMHGWFAGSVREALDGVLSPLRNVHKFDVVIRLPLVLGLAFALDSVLARTRGGGDPAASPDVSLLRVNRATVVGMALVAVVGAAVPVLQGRVEPAGATLDVPGYWQETAAWLGDRSGDNAALLVPGSGFAEYVWGSPKDEPMQFLADSRWAIRNAIPLAPPGNIRMLDGIETRLTQGKGSIGLTDAFRRAGIRYLVVRNDLRRAGDVADTVLVHQAIDQSPGIELVAEFGPDVGGEGHLVQGDARILVNDGWQAVYPAVQIFEVPDAAPAVSGPAPAVVAAGPEDLPDLADLGLLGEGPVVLAADAPADLPPQLATGTLVLTDGLRARERAFARIHDGTSSVITPGDVRRSGNPTRDYLIDQNDRWSTHAELRGARALSASSSASDSGELGGSRRGESPYAAVDDIASTEWVSGLGRSGRAWWAVTFDQPQSPTSVQLTGGDHAPANQVVRVRTDAGLSEVVELGPGEQRSVVLDGSPTRSLRVEDVDANTVQPLALAEVAVPGMSVRRTLVLPELPAAWGTPERIVLRTDADARTGCVEIQGDVRCASGRDRGSEEPGDLDRTIRLRQASSYDVELMVHPRAGGATLRRLLQDQPLGVNTSSSSVPDVRANGLAAVDGDLGTTWQADPDDLRPTLSVSWLDEREVSGLSMSVDSDTAARLPTEVRLTWPGGSHTVELQDGEASFPPVLTDQLRIQVLQAESATSLGFDAAAKPVTIGIGELRLTGVPYAPLSLSSDEVTYQCGTGPTVMVNGNLVRTQVIAAPAQLARGMSVHAEPCIDSDLRAPALSLRAGDNVVEVRARRGFLPDSLVLSRSDAEPDGVTTPSPVRPAGPASRTLSPATGSVVLAMRENANRGWTATQNDKTLTPIVVDGWQQGWLLDSGAAADEVRAEFAPDSTYRLGLAGGLVALLGLVALVGAMVVRGSRSDEDPPLRDRRLAMGVGLGVVVAGIGLLAGWPGLAIGVLVTPVSWWLTRRSADAVPFLAGALCLVAAIDYAVTPWGSASGWAGNDRWPHYLVLVSLTVALVSVLVEPGRPPRGNRGNRRFFRFRAGRSTTR